MKRKLRSILGGAVVVLLVTAPVAMANVFARHPSDPSYAEATVNRIRACDRHVDGHRVRAHYNVVLQYPDSYDISAWAPSGGCAEWQGGAWGHNIHDMRICVEGEGCGPWTRVN